METPGSKLPAIRFLRLLAFQCFGGWISEFNPLKVEKRGAGDLRTAQERLVLKRKPTGAAHPNE